MNNYTRSLILICCASLTLILFSCKNLAVPPNVRYNQYEFGKSVSYKNDTLQIALNNPLNCPLRIWFFSSDEQLQREFSSITPITLNASTDTILYFRNIKMKDESIRFSSRLGDVSKTIMPIELELPFPKNKRYMVVQENQTNFTHNTDWSRFALDFNLKTNDTICAATDGFVVGVVDQYIHSGKGKEWNAFGNFITLYHPESGIFTQYVHLVHKGSLVKIGDRIHRGQKIALAGNTGQSTGEHLHFGALIPVNNEDGLKSVPIEFVGGIKAVNLKKGDGLRK